MVDNRFITFPFWGVLSLTKTKVGFPKDCVAHYSWESYIFLIIEALPGLLGNRGTRAIFSGEQGNKGLKMRGTGKHRQFWGTGNIENQDFVLGEQGNKAIFSRGTREQVPLPPRWEGLIIVNENNVDEKTLPVTRI